MEPISVKMGEKYKILCYVEATQNPVYHIYEHETINQNPVYHWIYEHETIKCIASGKCQKINEGLYEDIIHITEENGFVVGKFYEILKFAQKDESSGWGKEVIFIEKS
jgi:hypothetical protein